MKKKNKKIKNQNKKRKTLEILEYGLWLLPLSLAPDDSDDDGRGEKGASAVCITRRGRKCDKWRGGQPSRQPTSPDGNWSPRLDHRIDAPAWLEQVKPFLIWTWGSGRFFKPTRESLCGSTSMEIRRIVSWSNSFVEDMVYCSSAQWLTV